MTIRNDAGAKKTVLDILSDEAIEKIDFWAASWHINPQLYRSVRHAIDRGEIKVIHDPALRKGGRSGAYSGSKDVLALAFDSIDGNTDHERLVQENMVVHECTHAGFDYRQIQHMSHLEGEGAAYIAGLIYLLGKCERTIGKAENYPIGHARDPAMDKVLKSAMAYAKNIYYKQGLSGRDQSRLLYRLEAGLRESDLYKTIYYKPVVNDGIGLISAS